MFHHKMIHLRQKGEKIGRRMVEEQTSYCREAVQQYFIVVLFILFLIILKFPIIYFNYLYGNPKSILTLRLLH